MRGSAVGWSMRVLAGAIGASWILPGATAFAQQGADAEMPAMKEAFGEILDERAEGNDESATVQKQIDELSDQTDELSAKYRTALTQIDSIRIYNHQLRGLISSQKEELTSLQDQLDRVEVVGRSVTPLMLRMIDALDAVELVLQRAELFVLGADQLAQLVVVDADRIDLRQHRPVLRQQLVGLVAEFVNIFLNRRRFVVALRARVEYLAERLLHGRHVRVSGRSLLGKRRRAREDPAGTDCARECAR